MGLGGGKKIHFSQVEIIVGRGGRAGETSIESLHKRARLTGHGDGTMDWRPEVGSQVLQQGGVFAELLESLKQARFDERL